MYKRDLDALLAKKELPRAFLLYGEPFFTDYYARQILSFWGPKEGVLSFYYDEYHFESAKSHIAQPSLFGDVNILYLRTDRKIPKKELDALVALTRKNLDSYFLLHFGGEDKTAKEIAKSFSKKTGGDFARFFKPRIGEAVAFLSEEAKRLGMTIENYALQHLYLLQNEDLPLCVSELEKLALLGKPVTISDIDTHVYGMGKIAMDDLIVRLLRKEDVRADLERLLQMTANEEIRILNAVTTYISRLLQFHIYIKVHGRYDVGEIVGYPLPPQMVKELAAMSIKFKLPVYRQLLAHLLTCEHALKFSQNIDKSSYLLSCLIKLQTFL